MKNGVIILIVAVFSLLLLISCASNTVSVKNKSITNKVNETLILSSADEIEKSKNETLRIHRDSLNNETVFYLMGNDCLADSLTVSNINFSFDSLTVINDSLWHYVYSSFNKLDGINLHKQVLIGVLKGRLHFSYVGIYRHNFLQTKKDPYGYFWDDLYELSLEGSLLGAHIKVMRNSQNINENDIHIDSSQSIILLKYDTDNKIYYNKLDTLNGIFLFVPNKFISHKKPIEPTKVLMNNEEVMTIKFKNTNYVYYKGRWFVLGSKPTDIYDGFQSLTPFQRLE